MAFNNLKTLKLRELTGSQFAGVGNVFSDPTSQADFRQISVIKNAVVDALTFTGGLPFPDGLKMHEQTVNASSKSYFPEDFFSTEDDSNSYMMELLGVSVTASGSDTGGIILALEDGQNTFTLQKATTVTASAPLTFLPTNPIYLNKNLYLTIINTASVDCPAVVMVGLVSRGGNPQ